MRPAIYRDIDGETHTKSETSIHHVYARSLTGRGSARKFINQNVLTPRMLDIYHNTGDKALHPNVELLRPPTGFVLQCMQSVINNLEYGNQYDRLIEYVDRVDDMALHAGNLIIRKECGRMAENLEMQMPYILRGQVELIQQ